MVATPILFALLLEALDKRALPSPSLSPFLEQDIRKGTMEHSRAITKKNRMLT
jgi:hypothetical protein